MRETSTGSQLHSPAEMHKYQLNISKKIQWLPEQASASQIRKEYVNGCLIKTKQILIEIDALR